ncbi:MAG TPA: Holliday junction resolvase RuvX [Anaerolineales bacterium]|nr:Holliday junction resolvase RuvX [Anaerolineales bacterium]
MRILAVDFGMKNIGIAVCDELMIAARELAIIHHTNREKDAAEIINLAVANKAAKIIVGVSFDDEGNPNDAGKQALNLIETLQKNPEFEIVGWDESLTTDDAKELKLKKGVSKKERNGHHDALAAAILLQGYIDQSGR